MTNQPTSTKPRTPGAEQDGLSSTYSSTFPQRGESELTAKAREVLAGLSDDERDMLRWFAGGTPPDWCAGNLERQDDAALRLCDVGLIRDCGDHEAISSFGREAARLLSEVQS